MALSFSNFSKHGNFISHTFDLYENKLIITKTKGTPLAKTIQAELH